MKQEQKLEQKLERRLGVHSTKESQDLVRKYVGKKVILELGGEETPVHSGDLTSYDGRFVKIDDYKSHKITLSSYLNPCSRFNPLLDISNKSSVFFSLPSRTINVDLIASIQLFEDVVRQREEGEEQ